MNQQIKVSVLGESIDVTLPSEPISVGIFVPNVQFVSEDWLLTNEAEIIFTNEGEPVRPG